jgi:hypothetical protein
VRFGGAEPDPVTHLFPGLRRARRATRAAEDARAAYDDGVSKLHRHIGAIHQMILPDALRYPAPEGVDHATWASALEQAIRALFPLT